MVQTCRQWTRNQNNWSYLNVNTKKNRLYFTETNTNKDVLEMLEIKDNFFLSLHNVDYTRQPVLMMNWQEVQKIQIKSWMTISRGGWTAVCQCNNQSERQRVLEIHYSQSSLWRWHLMAWSQYFGLYGSSSEWCLMGDITASAP